MTGHPLFDFGESDKEKHEKELQRAFNEAYQKYVQQGAGSMNPDKHITPKEIRDLCQGGYV